MSSNQFTEPWAQGPDDPNPPEHMVFLSEADIMDIVEALTYAIEENHEYMRFLAAHPELDDYSESDKDRIETRGNHWEELRSTLYQALPRDPCDEYGTPEHEWWLMELERRGDI